MFVNFIANGHTENEITTVGFDAARGNSDRSNCVIKFRDNLYVCTFRPLHSDIYDLKIEKMGADLSLKVVGQCRVDRFDF